MEEYNIPEEIIEEQPLEEAVEAPAKKRNWLWPVVAGVTALVIAAGLFFFLFNKKTDYKQYVELGQYIGIVAPLAKSEVTDDEVEKRIGEILEAATELVEIDAAAKNGDTVNIDYVGKYAATGDAFSGGTAEGQDLELGSKSYIDGFESGLVGTKKGDTVDLHLTFPDDYGNTMMAGAEVIFTVTVNAVYTPVTPTLDEAFVKENSSATTVDEYRTLVRKQLLEEKETAAREERRNKIWDTVYKNATILGYPEDEMAVYITDYTNMYTYYAENYGMTLEDFVTANKLTMDEFNELIKNYAKSDLEYLMIASVIADNHNITVSRKEYLAREEELLNQLGYESAADFEKDNGYSFNEQYTEKSILDNLMFSKVIAFLEEKSLYE